MYRQLRATNYINFDHVYKRENELSAEGKGDVCDSRCVHNLVETFHGQGLSVAQNHEFWEQKGNLGRQKTDRVRRLYGACF